MLSTISLGEVPISKREARFSGGTLFLFGAFFILNLPAFSYELAWNKYTGEPTGSVVIQAATIACDIFVLALILSSRQTSRLVIRCWPIIALAGLGLLSTAVSTDAFLTLRATHNFLTTSLLALALAGRLSPFECLQFVLRIMTLGCALSIVWVIFFPTDAVHQATDIFQSVHAGLWRGIFSHKQQFGIYSGFTLGLLMFYGSVAFPSPLLRLGAIACAAICLLGAQSKTGFLTPISLAILLYVTRWISCRPPRSRMLLIKLEVLSLIFLGLCYLFGVFDFVPELMGKPRDLNGRSSFWPYLLALFRDSGNTYLGAGYGSYFSTVLGVSSVDNGYVEKVIEFGYLGAAIVFAILGWIAWAGARLVAKSEPDFAGVQIFPLCFMAALFLDNITEGEFMKKDFLNILLAVAVAIVFQTGGNSRKRSRVEQVRYPAPTDRPHRHELP